MSIKIKEYEKGTYVIDNEYAYVWCLKTSNQKGTDYCYGGTRTVDPTESEKSVFERLCYLGRYESGLKNYFINQMIKDNVFSEFSDRLPEGFQNSYVEGGRCIIQPKDQEAFSAISNTTHSEHKKVLDSVFSDLGELLNELDGKLKLTPDFGRYAGLADMLHQYTENVLGIDCADGGCGGKASYTSTGIIQAAETLGAAKDQPITLIGSAGACGIGVLNYLMDNQYSDIAVCDLVYDNTNAGKQSARQLSEKGIKVLHSEDRKLTKECLSRGGMIIATTVGGEFLRSEHQAMKDGTVLLLAHNECIRTEEDDYAAVDKIVENRNIIIVPGQLLTFGGALTSRIEWFYRQSRKGEYFDKPLAHDVVKAAAAYMMNTYALKSNGQNLFRKVFDLI